MGLADGTRRASMSDPIDAQGPLRVLVVAHVYYPELWPEVADCIALVPEPRDIVVTLVTGRADGMAGAIVERFPDASVLAVQNRGRDQWPLLQVLLGGALAEDVDVVLKLHTKASTHRLDGRRWRRRMLDSLCGSSRRVDEILSLFGSDPALGVVAPAGGLLGREFWGGNAELIDDLAARLDIPVDLERTFFPGGSMYWARVSLLRQLGELGLDEADFPPEPLPGDGTTAHALERLVGVIAAAQGLDVVAADEVPARLAHIRTKAISEDSHGR